MHFTTRLMHLFHNLCIEYATTTTLLLKKSQKTEYNKKRSKKQNKTCPYHHCLCHLEEETPGKLI